MKRIAIIQDQSGHFWKSCEVISRNISSCYKNIQQEGQFKYFNYAAEISDYQICLLAKEIRDFYPDTIIFTEHKPHPRKLMEFLDMLYPEDSQRPSFIFHVYGDFVLYAKEWIGIESILKKSPSRFLCASMAQSRLLCKLVHSPEEMLSIVPFPVNQTDYHYSPSLRAEYRKKFSLNEEDRVFLYTGRLSTQKNITTLLKFFDHYLNVAGENHYLYLAGSFDNLGIPYLNIRPSNYFLEVQNVLKTFPPGHQEKIKFLGQQDEKALHILYNIADCFISLSVHNDEDFGMSPAEALCSGLPSILSNWGGYYSFQLPEIPQACQLVPVKMGQQYFNLDTINLTKHAFKQSSAIHDDRLRSQISETYLDKFSVSSVQKLLKEIISTDQHAFQGFTQQMREIINSQNKNNGSPFLETMVTYNSLYMELYDGYTGKL